MALVENKTEPRNVGAKPIKATEYFFGIKVK
jgi:hypothetical protein